MNKLNAFIGLIVLCLVVFAGAIWFDNAAFLVLLPNSTGWDRFYLIGFWLLTITGTGGRSKWRTYLALTTKP